MRSLEVLLGAIALGGSVGMPNGEVVTTAERLREAYDDQAAAEAERLAAAPLVTPEAPATTLTAEDVRAMIAEEVRTAVERVVAEKTADLPSPQQLTAHVITVVGEALAQQRLAEAAQAKADGGQGAPPQGDKAALPKADTNDIPPAVVEALRAAGFDTAEKIVAASDEELLKVPGVGQATVNKLRAAQQAQS